MPTALLDQVPWPAGTSVELFEGADVPPSGGEPPGTSVGSATVSASSDLTTPALDPGNYVATATISGHWRYLRFKVDPPDEEFETVAFLEPNGSDDTDAVVRALESGAKVRPADGTFWLRGNECVLFDESDIEGSTGTIFKQIAGTSGPMFKTDTFDDWADTEDPAHGGSPPLGWEKNTRSIRLKQFTVDGNKDNCPGGTMGLALWGIDIRTEHVHVHDCKTDGVFSDFSVAGAIEAEPEEQGFIHRHDHLDIHNCGRDGLRMFGPDDSILNRCIMWKNVGKDCHVSGRAIGLSLDQCHFYSGNSPTTAVGDYGLWADTFIYANQCIFESHTIASVYLSGAATSYAPINGASKSIFRGCWFHTNKVTGSVGLYLDSSVNALLGIRNLGATFINNNTHVYLKGNPTVSQFQHWIYANSETAQDITDGDYDSTCDVEQMVGGTATATGGGVTRRAGFFQKPANMTAHLPTLTPAATENIFQGTADTIPIILKAFAGQVQPLMRLLNSAGTPVAQWNVAGGLNLTGIIASMNASKAFLTLEGDTGGILVSSGAAANKALVLRAFTSQSENIQEVQAVGGTVYERTNKDGYRIIRKTAAPADGDLAANEVALWFDATNGAAKLKIKGKSANGTVVSGEVALA